MKTTAVTTTRPQLIPFTGAEYLESLRDGRLVEKSTHIVLISAHYFFTQRALP